MSDEHQPTEETPRTLSELQTYIHDWAKRLGWWDSDVEESRPPSSQIALMHSELSEALECLRSNHAPNEVWFTQDTKKSGMEKPEGFGIELADCVIRILDTCERYGIDLGAAVIHKMRYNETRTYRHGGKTL